MPGTIAAIDTTVNRYTKTADNTRLRDKPAEEGDEFIASDNDPEELADILEVLYALAGQAGPERQQLEELRAAKAMEHARRHQRGQAA
jgi:predicted house-cleaning noncanonical NTP pyrophosphatase (MazG superfamily)